MTIPNVPQVSNRFKFHACLAEDGDNREFGLIVAASSFWDKLEGYFSESRS